MKLQLKPEQGGILVSAKDALPPDGRDYGEHMLLAAVVLEVMHSKATFVVEKEELPEVAIMGWLARKAGTNTVIGFEPSSRTQEIWDQIERETGYAWEPAVRNGGKVGRLLFFRPADKKHRRQK